MDKTLVNSAAGIPEEDLDAAGAKAAGVPAQRLDKSAASATTTYS